MQKKRSSCDDLVFRGLKTISIFFLVKDLQDITLQRTVVPVAHLVSNAKIPKEFDEL